MVHSRRHKFREAKVKRVVLVASRFNESITTTLVEGALDVLQRGGVAREQIHILRVPGAFELPAAAAYAARTVRPNAVIALGCLMKGQTPQYLVIGHAVAHGLTQVSLAARIPVTFGLIISDSFAQAKARAGGRIGHRGREAAQAALEMIGVLRKFSQKAEGRKQKADGAAAD